VDQLPRAIKGPVNTVLPLIKAKSELGNMDHIMNVLGKGESLTSVAREN
jgi:ATP-binding cassette subfamily E protein 1